MKRLALAVALVALAACAKDNAQPAQGAKMADTTHMMADSTKKADTTHMMADTSKKMAAPATMAPAKAPAKKP
jgi:hypothetical protein